MHVSLFKVREFIVSNNSHPLLPYPLPFGVDSNDAYAYKAEQHNHMTGHMTNHVTYLPDWHHEEEEKAQCNIPYITEDTVEGTQSTKGMGTLEVVVALVLITTEVENLKT